MAKFREWLQLNESMDVYVGGHEYHNDLNGIDDLANEIKRKLLYPAWEKLTPEGKEAVQKGGSAQHFMLTPDGDFYSGKGQTLNFYTAGWGDQVNSLIQGIKYYLDERKVKYGPFRTENSGMFRSPVVRIPILQFNPTQNNAPLLNMSNQNAMTVFHDLLGYQTDGTSFEMSPADLLIKIENLEKHQLDIHARDPYSVQKKGGAQIYDMGLSSQGIQQRLEQIKKIAKWAMDNHYDSIYVA